MILAIGLLFILLFLKITILAFPSLLIVIKFIIWPFEAYLLASILIELFYDLPNTLLSKHNENKTVQSIMTEMKPQYAFIVSVTITMRFLMMYLAWLWFLQ